MLPVTCDGSSADLVAFRVQRPADVGGVHVGLECVDERFAVDVVELFDQGSDTASGAFANWFLCRECGCER